jgi:capsular exopolysaccharide synthesis family protein
VTRWRRLLPPGTDPERPRQSRPGRSEAEQQAWLGSPTAERSSSAAAEDERVAAGGAAPPQPRPKEPETHSARGRRETRVPTTERSGWVGPSRSGYAATAQPSGGFDVISILGVLKRRAWVVILCTLLVGGGIYAYYDRQPESYVATAKLLFSDPGLDQAIVAPNARTQAPDPEREAATNLEGVAVRPVAQRTARAIGGGLSAESVASHIAVSADGRSNFVSVRASAGDPLLAARIATTYAREYIAYRRAKAVTQIRAAQAVVHRRLGALSRTTRRARNLPQSRLSQSQSNALDEERTLREQDNQLSVLASLQTGGAELAEAALPPTSPAAPQTTRNAILGGIVGLLLGVSLAFLFERLDRHVKEPSQLRGNFHQPTVGKIPESRALRRPKKYIGGGLPALEGEAFRLLWANLRYYNADRDIRSLLVTSPVPGEGKTTIALHVAAIAASTGSRTLLIEADLRRPPLAAMLGLPAEHGLISVIHGDTELQDAVQRVRLPYVDGIAPLEALFAGGAFSNPTILLDSPAFRHLLREVEREYDLVVIDAPSTAFVSDAIPLLTRVSGVLVVTRLGRSTRVATSQLASQLENVDAPVLGLAVNSVSNSAPADDYDGAVANARTAAR